MRDRALGAAWRGTRLDLWGWMMRLLRGWLGAVVVGLGLLVGSAWAASENQAADEGKPAEKPPVLEYIATVVLTAGGVYAVCRPSRRLQV